MGRLNLITVGVAATAATLWITGCTPSQTPAPTTPFPPSPTPSATPLYPAGYGELEVESTGLVYFTYGPVLEEVNSRSEVSRVVVPEGDYTVTVYMAPDGVDVESYAAGDDEDPTTAFSATIRVEEGLRSTVVATATPRPVEKVASTSDLNIVPVGVDAYLSYDIGETLSLHRAGVNGPRVLLADVRSACRVSDSEALVLTGKEAYVYNAETGDLDPLTVSDPLLNHLPSAHGKCVAGSVQAIENGRIVRIGRDYAELTDLPPGWERIARGPDRNLVADATARAVAMVLGNDNESYDAPPGDGETVLVECTLVLENLERPARREIPLGLRSDIAAVSLSPSGSRVAVVYDRLVQVYDVATGELAYSMPSSYSYAAFWRGDNRLVYVGESSEVGAGFNKLYIADIEKSESYGLTDNTKVNVSILSDVVEDDLYFSGVTYVGETSERSGYRIDLE